MGTYRDRARELRAAGFVLDLVVYESADLSFSDTGVRRFMLDPDWHPWLDHGFSPFGEVGAGGPVFSRGKHHHGSFDLAREAIGMASKPGGGTLLDSLWSATPVMFAEPFGAHEERNARLWCELGFGVSFDDWRDTGFDVAVLEAAHRALLDAAGQCYLLTLIGRDLLLNANSRSQGTDSLSKLGEPSAAGALTTMLGTTGGLAVGTLPFLAAALGRSRIRHAEAAWCSPPVRAADWPVRR